MCVCTYKYIGIHLYIHMLGDAGVEFSEVVKSRFLQPLAVVFVPITSPARWSRVTAKLQKNCRIYCCWWYFWWGCGWDPPGILVDLWFSMKKLRSASKKNYQKSRNSGRSRNICHTYATHIWFCCTFETQFHMNQTSEIAGCMCLTYSS